MNYLLVNCDCLDYLATMAPVTTIMADPPDNLGLKYNTYRDKKSESDYIEMLRLWLNMFVMRARTVWFSYNAKWTFEVGKIVTEILGLRCGDVEAKLCIQSITFGQHNHHDLGNNYRPLLRLRWHDAPLYPDAIRVPSWRMLNDDKRADPRGRVPSDVFDFPRVTGNSHQRRKWHVTQLHEGLVERCIKLTTPADGWVVDPFVGSGTTLRVCKQLGICCTGIDMDKGYCENIAKELEMTRSEHCHRAIWEAKLETAVDEMLSARDDTL